MDSAAAEHSESRPHPSSDAETEPLPFDDRMSDDDRRAPAQGAPLPERPAPAAQQSAPRPDFSGESELSESGSDAHNTQEPQNTANPPPFSDDGSSLSDEDERQAGSGALDALDGLATLAASVNHPEEDPSSALSSVGDRAGDADDENDDDDADADADAPDSTATSTLDPQATPRKSTSTMQRAILAAAGKRRAAATGGAPSLLQGDGDSSVPPSATTSRQPSPVANDAAESHESETAPEAHEQDADMEVKEESAADAEAGAEEAEETEAKDEEGAAEGEGAAEAEAEGEAEAEAKAEAEAEAEAEEEAEAEDEGAGGEDSEAAKLRQEAIDLLTRVEIGFAMLRDRLFIERKEELEAETAMLNDGTHPELQYLHLLIDTRKERRIALLDTWLAYEKAEHALRARDDDDIAWLNWRERAATIRRDMIEDTYRKRRKLDQEKRLLEAPRLPRRHQPFDAELVHKQVPWEAERSGDMQNYLAYPDVRGLDEYDTWMDMEQMGLPVPQGFGYPRPEEMVPPDMYPPYYGGGPFVAPYGAPAVQPYDIPSSVPSDAPVYVDEYGRMLVYDDRQYAYPPDVPRAVA